DGDGGGGGEIRGRSAKDDDVLALGPLASARMARRAAAGGAGATTGRRLWLRRGTAPGATARRLCRGRNRGALADFLVNAFFTARAGLLTGRARGRAAGSRGRLGRHADAHAAEAQDELPDRAARLGRAYNRAILAAGGAATRL